MDPIASSDWIARIDWDDPLNKTIAFIVVAYWVGYALRLFIQYMENVDASLVDEGESNASDNEHKSS